MIVTGNLYVMTETATGGIETETEIEDEREGQSRVTRRIVIALVQIRGNIDPEIPGTTCSLRSHLESKCAQEKYLRFQEI